MKVKVSGEKSNKNLTIVLVGFILPVLVGGLVYWWQQSVLRSERRDAREIKTSLEEQIEMLQQQVNALRGDDNQTPDEVGSLDAAALKAIAEGNDWPELESQAASSVEVILGASEGLGTRTPAQMIEDLKYLDSASGPWNFTLDSSIIDDYRSGDYGQYFAAEEQIIGRSSDGYVVVFTLSDDKITDIFMIGDDELL